MLRGVTLLLSALHLVSNDFPGFATLELLCFLLLWEKEDLFFCYMLHILNHKASGHKLHYLRGSKEEFLEVVQNWSTLGSRNIFTVYTSQPNIYMRYDDFHP